MRSGLATAVGAQRHQPTACPDAVVVDDEETAAKEMAHCLAKAGLACVALSDPWQALKLLTSVRRPRIAIIDIRMPELNGLELVERLNFLGRPDRPEIILVSGNAGLDDAIVAMRLGVRRLLCKPLDLAQLVREAKTTVIERDLRAGQATATEQGQSHKPLDVNTLIALSHERERFFSKEMLSDHCWRMYLELYKSTLAGHRVSLTSLALVSGLPMATAVRKIHAMRDLNLVNYAVDPKDKRRTFVNLSEAAVGTIEGFMKHLDAKVSGKAIP